GAGLTPVRSGPVTTEPVRSDTFGATPLSSTATVTPWPSLPAAQADGTFIMSRAHIWPSWTESAGSAEATGAATSPAVAAVPAQAAAGRAGRARATPGLGPPRGRGRPGGGP